MMNAERGETAIEIEGARRRLRLTLAALAEIEDATECADPADLPERLRRMHAGTLAVVLEALLRAGGAGAEAGRLAGEAEPAAAAQAVAACFRANLG